MLSSREARNVVREIGQRLEANNCRWEQCKEYMIVCEGLGPADDGGMQIFLEFSPQDSIRIILVISVTFRSIVPKIPSEHGGQPGALWRTRGEATFAEVRLLGPHLAATSDWTVFPGAFLPAPAPLFFHVCGGRKQFLLKYLVFPNLIINWMLHKDVLETLDSSLNKIGAVHPTV